MDTVNFKGAWSFLKLHGKALTITFFASAVVAALISLLLPNYYKSEVLLLPSEDNSISKTILSEGSARDPYSFGTEKESEYILEMLSSWQIIEKTAAKFNLKEHYHLNNTPLSDERMLLKLQKNIKIKRSDYMGAKLQVWDKDAKYACDMANYMVKELENLRLRMRKAKADSIKYAVEMSKKRVQEDITKLNDSLTKIQIKTHIAFPANYYDRLAMEIAKQIAAGNTAAVARLDKRMANIDSNGAEIQQLLDDKTNKSKMIVEWDEYYEKAMLDLNSDIPVDFVAQYATVAQKKDKPKRSIIVILAAICCTIIAGEYFVIKDKYFSSKSKDETIS